MHDNAEQKLIKPKIRKNKLTIIIVGIIVLLIPPLLLLISTLKPTIQKQTYKPGIKTALSVTPAMSAELKAAIEQQKKVDTEYNSFQEDTHTKYPWMGRLPLTSPKYFVYFDLDQKVFIGKLYTTPTDNVENLKTEIVQKLKNDKQIPVDNFRFSWLINP